MLILLPCYHVPSYSSKCSTFLQPWCLCHGVILVEKTLFVQFRPNLSLLLILRIYDRQAFSVSHNWAPRNRVSSSCWPFRYTIPLQPRHCGLTKAVCSFPYFGSRHISKTVRLQHVSATPSPWPCASSMSRNMPSQ